MDFDELLYDVGDFHRYQKIMYLVICLPAALPCAWTAFNQVFVAAVPKHRCRSNTVSHQFSHNLSVSEHEKLVSCSQSSNFTGVDPNISTSATFVPCDTGWEYDQETYRSTIVTEFDLVCDRNFWPSLSTMIFYFGSFIGNILFGYIADRWGRRASFFSILTVQVIFGTANAFAPDIYSFTILRFIVGLTFPALYQVPFIIGMELMGPPGRIFAGIVVCVFFGSSMCLLGVVASLIREWSLLTIICNTPFVLLFSYWWFLPESPRWLVSERKFEAAANTLLTMSRCNGKSCDLIVYNGLTLNVSNLPVNDYLSFSINGAVEVPAYLLIWPLLDTVGRRLPLCGAMLLGGISCICTTFVPHDSGYVISGLAFVGKFGIAASFAIIYIFAGELYPTVVRAIGMGMSSMVAGSGLLLAPYLVDLAKFHRILPLLIMGGLTITAGVTSMLLPETLGAPLPQTVLEAEEYGKTFPLCHWKPQKTQDKQPVAHETIELLENKI